jgi:hypothetical protein
MQLRRRRIEDLIDHRLESGGDDGAHEFLCIGPVPDGDGPDYRAGAFE